MVTDEMTFRPEVANLYLVVYLVWPQLLSITDEARRA